MQAAGHGAINRSFLIGTDGHRQSQAAGRLGSLSLRPSGPLPLEVLTSCQQDWCSSPFKSDKRNSKVVSIAQNVVAF